MLYEMEVAINEIDKVADSYLEQIRKTLNDDEKCKNFMYIAESSSNLEKLHTLLLAKIAIRNNFFNNCINKSDLGICKLTKHEKYCCRPNTENDCTDFKYKGDISNV